MIKRTKIFFESHNKYKNNKCKFEIIIEEKWDLSFIFETHNLPFGVENQFSKSLNFDPLTK